MSEAYSNFFRKGTKKRIQSFFREGTKLCHILAYKRVFFGRVNLKEIEEKTILGGLGAYALPENF